MAAFTQKKDDVHSVYQADIKKGVACRIKGDYQEALRFFDKGYTAARDLEDISAQLDCLMNLGLLFWNMGKMSESASSYKQALHLAQAIKTVTCLEKCRAVLEIFRLYSEAKGFRAQGKWEQSIKCFESAILLARKYQSPEHELKCLRQMSTVYWRMNKNEKFLELNEKAFLLADKLNHKREKGKIWNHKGLYFWKEKDYSKALVYFQRSLNAAREFQDREAESSCLNNMGLVYKDFGYYDKALKMLNQALAIDEELDHLHSISVDMNNIGSLYIRRFDMILEKEDLDQAQLHFRRSLELARHTNSRNNEMNIMNNLGTVYLKKKESSRALRCLHEALDLAVQLDDKAAQGMILINTGSSYICAGKRDEAEKSFKEALLIAEPLQEQNVLWEALYGLGQVCEKQGRIQEAVSCYQRSVDIIDSLRQQIVLDTDRSRFVQHKLRVYERLIELVFKQYRLENDLRAAEAVFHWIERAKARSLLDMLGESRFLYRERLSPDLKEEENQLSSNIAGLRQRLMLEKLSTSQRMKILTQMKSAEEEYMQLLNRMRTEMPEVAGLIQPETCSLLQAQRKLCSRTTAVVEYFLGDLSSYMCVITQDSFHCFRLPPREKIKDSIRAFLKVLSGPPSGRFKHRKAARRIYRELFEKADNLFSSEIKTVIIIPDEILCFLPFDALIRRTGGREREKQEWIVERYALTYSPSASSLVLLNERALEGPKPKSFLAFGNPDYRSDRNRPAMRDESSSELLYELFLASGFWLSPIPLSEKEVRRAARSAPHENRDVYVRSRARESLLKKLPLEKYGIVHFACHGFLDRRFPFRSALVLSLDDIDQSEDGFLLVREIYNLRFQADLVVLSACQTGAGKLLRGEGVLGLPRIFFYTGARAVLSTLWKIDDRTSAGFMRVFYRNLSRGLDKAEALRQTKLRMIKSARSHPFFWSAYILNGNYHPIIPQQ